MKKAKYDILPYIKFYLNPSKGRAVEKWAYDRQQRRQLNIINKINHIFVIQGIQNGYIRKNVTLFLRHQITFHILGICEKRNNGGCNFIVIRCQRRKLEQF